ncbi:hypothetical protein BB561_002620 [Smittium simulii]|uniref:Carboxymuconolactone decarboxylase-like domain-containing protein n=1 Tax=Smittium simulii TaxID=133385 RepID=A0A2T9YPR0_9FUNG|nr:hypothetical protein BB561_002620 [Smittium simulii]
MCEYGFIDKYIDTLGCELAVCISVIGYATANKSKIACRIVSNYLIYLSNSKDISFIFDGKHENNPPACDFKFDEQWFLKNNPQVQQEVISFIEKIREYIFKISINIGIPLCLVMFKELQECVGSYIYSKLSSKSDFISESSDYIFNIHTSNSLNDFKSLPTCSETSSFSRPPEDIKAYNNTCKSSLSYKNNSTSVSSYSSFQNTRLEFGLRYFEQVYGTVKDKLLNSIHSFHPNLDYVILANGYGDILSSGSLLTPSEIEIALITSITLINTPVQLHSHIRGALRVGTPKQIVDSAKTCLNSDT